MTCTTGRLLSALSVIVCLLTPAYVPALTSDKEQPVEIEADFAEFDDKAKRMIYKGNVISTQGTIRLSGDTLTIYYTDENDIKTVVLVGSPARFKQRPDNATIDNQGKATKIEYHALENRVVMLEDAELTQGGKRFLSHRIDYDTERSVLTAHGAKPETNGASSGKGRIRVILPPKKH